MWNKYLLAAAGFGLGILATGCGGDDGGGATAKATVAGFMGGTITGSGTFTQSGTSVSLTLTLTNCVDTKVYAAHIHQGASCADATAQGGHWDTTRGEGIPSVTCAGTTGTVTYTRTPEVATTAWTVGDGAATDVIGHVIVVHDPDTATTRVACGAIAAGP